MPHTPLNVGPTQFVVKSTIVSAAELPGVHSVIERPLPPGASPNFANSLITSGTCGEAILKPSPSLPANGVHSGFDTTYGMKPVWTRVPPSKSSSPAGRPATHAPCRLMKPRVATRHGSGRVL